MLCREGKGKTEGMKKSSRRFIKKIMRGNFMWLNKIGNLNAESKVIQN